MTDLFIFLAKAAIINAVILLFYFFALRKSNKFLLMRATLVLAMVLPLLLPLIPLPEQNNELSKGFIPLITINLPVFSTDYATIQSNQLINIANVPMMLYLAITLFFLVSVVVSISSILYKLFKSKTYITKFGRVELEQSVKSPFSFFSWVFLSPDNLEHPNLEMLLQHEFCHVKEKHSIDKLVSGIFRSILWFSPFAHITCNLLSQVNEYQADANVIKAYDRTNYSNLILSYYLTPWSSTQMSNNFSLHIKKRIIMINNFNTIRLNYKRLISGLLVVFSAITVTTLVNAGSSDNIPGINTKKTDLVLSNNNSSVTIGNPDTIPGNRKATKKVDRVFTEVEEPPQFPGGDEARAEYMSKNINYSDEARKNGIEGTVFVSFIVQSDGSITDTKILRGVNKLLDDVALKAVKNMPKWQPGKMKGKSVAVQFNMPIKFKLSKEETKKQ